MPARVARLLAAALLFLAVPSGLLAHGDGEPWIFVPVDYVRQGEEMTVFAADLGPGAPVTLAIWSSGQMYPLGQAVTDADGHFTQSFVVPSGIPDGYAEVRAASEDGSEASVWVLVGAPADLAIEPPATENAPAPGLLSDPSVLALGVLVVGAAGALAWMIIRRRQPAAVAAHAARAARSGSVKGQRKARRRPT